MKWKVYNKLMREEWVDEKPVQPKHDLKHAEKPPLLPVETEYGEDANGEYSFSLKDLPLIDTLPRTIVPDIKLQSIQYWLDHLGPAIYNPLRAYQYENGAFLFQKDGGHRSRCLWEIGEPMIRVVIRKSPHEAFTKKSRWHYGRFSDKVAELNERPPTVTHFRINPNMSWRQYYPCEYPPRDPNTLNRFFKETFDGIYYKDTLDSPMSFREILSQNKRLSYRLDIFDEINKFNLREKTVLDVGSYFGHYSFLAIENGATKAAGVESNRFRARVAILLARRRGLTRGTCKFEGHHKPIQDYLKETEETFDFIFLLNVFHHLLKQGSEQGWDTINTLLDRSNQLFLLTGNRWKVFGKWDGDIERAVREKTGATICPLIKTNYRNRTLYAVK